MVDNVKAIESLTGLYRIRSKEFDFKVVHPADLDIAVQDGWEFVKKFTRTVQVRRKKHHGIWLEDRVWRLFYKMGFSSLSGQGGGVLTINPKEKDSPTSQIDIVAIDREVALAIECKSSSVFKKRISFQEELGKFCQIREPFSKYVRTELNSDGIKKQPILIMFLYNSILSDEDRQRAKNNNVIIFENKDLDYYENLVNHLGPAAKYQILSDMLPGKEIPGLAIKIPAIRSKMGGNYCYNFTISPDFLLKIAYVSHRSKGKASDVNTYQRMMTKQRLGKIKDYISQNGIFPTNIILNFEKKLNFQRIEQETEFDGNHGIMGWLEIKASYKSAWVIDGQHRLYAYSGHPKASKSTLSVSAFESLKPSQQAELFIDINAKQKSVKQSLLQELFAELHWDSDNVKDKISAIVSKAIQDLNVDPESPIYNRVQSTDGTKDNVKCVTLTSLFSQIERKGFFIAREKNGNVLEYGPLWGGDKPEETLKRTTSILKDWLNEIVALNKRWWDIGSGEGGGLAMNDGISTLIAMLKTVFDVIEKNGFKTSSCSTNEVITLLKPYGQNLGKYLATLDEKQRKAFRDLRGAAGITYRTKQCQAGLRNFMPKYNPDGLDEWLNLQKQQTNKNAKEIIDNIEVQLQDSIVEELKINIGTDEDTWWYDGVPQPIRTKVTSRMEEDKNKRGGKEYYFDLIDYKKIMDSNWEVFEKLFGYGNGGKSKKLEWLDFINEIRKIVAHASSGKTVNLDDYQKIQEISSWLGKQLSLQSTNTIDEEIE